MNLETYGTFVIAAMIVLVIPGPTIILVISQSAGHGRRAVLPLAAGVTLGDFTAMALSLLGLGAVLAASAALFTILKWIGALYLIYLGIKLWRSNPTQQDLPSLSAAVSSRRFFASAYVVTALNPKSIVFFVAFLPQFVNHHAPIAFQLIVLGATFLILAALNASMYGLFAGRLRDVLQKEAALRWFNRCGGSALIGAGIFTAVVKQSS
ncbi:MAG: LysE family translocator [Desulfobacterales bacterium]|jgi:threonine/homoserine/homoserine lactone efflux protein